MGTKQIVITAVISIVAVAVSRKLGVQDTLENALPLPKVI